MLSERPVVTAREQWKADSTPIMTAILRIPPAAYHLLEVVLEEAPGVAKTEVTIFDNRLRARNAQLSDVQAEIESAINSSKAARGFTWVDVQSGTEWPACEALIDALELTLLAEGAERIEQVEGDGHVAGLLREYATEGSGQVLHFFYFHSGLLTLHRTPSPCIAGALQVGRDINSIWHSDTVMALLLSSTLAPLVVPVQQVTAEGEAMEALVLSLSERDEGDLLLRLSIAQTRVARLKAFVASKRVLIGELSDAKKSLGGAMHSFLSHLSAKHKYHLGVLNLAANRLADHGSTYLGKLQVDVAQGNDKTNGILRVLTVVSTITLPLMFGQGLFSMNLDLPGRSTPNLNWWLGIISVCTLAVIVGLLALRRITWL